MCPDFRFACRSERQSMWQLGFTRNRTLLLGIGVEVLLLLLLIYVLVFAATFGLTGLQWQHWCLLVAFGPVLLALEEVRKIVSRKYWP